MRDSWSLWGPPPTSPRRVAGRGLGSKSWCPGPPARRPLFPPSPVRGCPAGRALRTGKAPGGRSGRVSSRSCGGKEGPRRRGWRPVLPAGARWCACLPVLPAGAACWAGSWAGAIPRPCLERVALLVYLFSVVVLLLFWFIFHKGREDDVLTPSQRFLSTHLDGVFLSYLFLALFLVLVLGFFLEISINIYHFIKK